MHEPAPHHQSLSKYRRTEAEFFNRPEQARNERNLTKLKQLTQKSIVPAEDQAQIVHYPTIYISFACSIFFVHWRFAWLCCICCLFVVHIRFLLHFFLRKLLLLY